MGLSGISFGPPESIVCRCGSPSSLLCGTNGENPLEVGGKNRSVMPLDVLGCTRATMTDSTSFSLARKGWLIFENLSYQGLLIAIIRHESGMPCTCESTAHREYDPALCTHRPSLLPIGVPGEKFGVSLSWRQTHADLQSSLNLGH